jgi:hypothetical protein
MQVRDILNEILEYIFDLVFVLLIQQIVEL